MEKRIFVTFIRFMNKLARAFEPLRLQTFVQTRMISKCSVIRVDFQVYRFLSVGWNAECPRNVLLARAKSEECLTSSVSANIFARLHS